MRGLRVWPVHDELRGTRMTLELNELDAESLQARSVAKEARASMLRAQAERLLDQAADLELEALALWHRAADLEEYND